MNIMKSPSALVATAIGITLGAYSFASQANNGPGHNWVPNESSNTYWQAPNWSTFRSPPAARRQAPPVYVPPAQAEQPAARPAPVAPQRVAPQQYYPAQGMNRPRYNTRPNMQRNAPPQNMNRGRPPMPYSQGQPRRPYYGPNQGPSAFNTPGYRPNRNNNNRWGNNRFGNNKFWGRSGFSSWMSPGKDNWEQSWDDMINAPSRMGEMPGGWTAPEVTVPNPIDMGDQMQENAQDLPEQMRNMDVGNDVKD